MDPEFADLVPLFVSEARERLERLALLVRRLEENSDAATEARRELHTLKGAGRMLQLGAISELCHAAEATLQERGPAAGPSLIEAIDALAAMVDAVAAGNDPQPAGQLVVSLTGGHVAAAPAAVRPAAAIEAPATSADVRVDTSAIDAMTERAARIRILAQGAEAITARLDELAGLADKGSREPNPEQILSVLSTSLRTLSAWVEAAQRRLRRTAETQLETILSLQLQPLRGSFLNLARHARDLARSLGRQVEVEISGEDVRLDRRIARELDEALLHAVRNAVDHGIESPTARTAAGKPPTGTLRLAARAEGHQVHMEIADDGAGIEPARVVAAAIESGLIDSKRARDLAPGDVLRLLFAPGFSTRSTISELSGRGVGLDAVATAVHRVGGRVELHSEPARGTRLVIEVPVARRGEQLLVVRAGGLRFAVARAWLRHAAPIDAERLIERSGRSFAHSGERLVPVVPLARLFGEREEPHQLLLEGEVAGQSLALAVDGVEGEVEALVRPVRPHAGVGPLVEGLTLLPSGEPVAVLSLPALGRVDVEATATPPQTAAAARPLGVLLVDDSLVTREMERRLLEDAGLVVTTAGDASEALARLAEVGFDCLIADIEMPGMDGLELTRRMRALPQLAQLPVIVVSTRDRPEDRLAALEAGADAYLSKRRLDAGELVGLIRRLGGRR
jgi:two-component system, chemotaxis family, sensor kinase CheA